jgi:elongation factor Ts
MSVTAGMVKNLRQRTSAGMMECKKALVESGGDMERAAKLLREKGAASAGEKAGRIAAEGKIVQKISADGRHGVLIEVNCETDFVARADSFGTFADQVADYVAAQRPESLDQLLGGILKTGESVEDSRNTLIGRIGENVSVRRFEMVEVKEGRVSGYLHGRKIGVLVSVRSGTEELGHDLAMHIAASNPRGIDESEIPEKELVREREIYLSQAANAGKPANVIEKIVDGRLKKYLKENTLLGQNFVKDTEITIADLLRKNGAKVSRIVRYELGEGLEKRSDNFVGEVLAQAAGN